MDTQQHPLTTDYQRFIHLSRYSRWLPEHSTREEWGDTVERYITHLAELVPEYADWLHKVARPAIYNVEVMPSMRAMMTAGEALKRDAVAAYNCAYLTFDRTSSFSELMYILTCGAGVGFSVEDRYVSKLPGIPGLRYNGSDPIIVADSKYGWADAVKSLVNRLYAGEIPAWDLSRVRSKGTRLRTFGGRASGPEPLDNLLGFIVETFQKRQGAKLTRLDVHDIACMTGQCVVSGGVRRSALISLSDPWDYQIANAKTGDWYVNFPWRAVANNSAVYEEQPNVGDFLQECATIYHSKAGERGFFNRTACKSKAENVLRDPGHEFGTNPCCEIILRPFQFCNLTEVVARPSDTVDTLEDKIRVATILGTLQSTITDFKVLNSNWRKNCEEERLLGVSITGIYDNKLLSNLNNPSALEGALMHLRSTARVTNEQTANRLGIPVSAAITCVKPSGTVSQLVDSSNGLHPRFSRYFVRRVGLSTTDPLCDFLVDNGVPHVAQNENTWLFEFPMASPEDAKVVSEVTAAQHFKLWRIYNYAYCEHKPSVSIYYSDAEYLGLVSDMYKYWDELSGIAIFPKADHIFTNIAPYLEIDGFEYNRRVKEFPPLDWDKLVETDDNTEGSRELACTGGACEL